MANTFLRKTSRNVGNIATAVGGYTVGANIGAVVVGLSLSNTTGSQIRANVAINNGSNDFYLVKDAPILDSSTLVLVGNEQKVVLQTGDSIKVTSSDDSSIDVLMTVMETDGAGISLDPIGASPVTITANVSSVDEGNTVAFSVSNITANAFAYANGTYYWTTNSVSGTVVAADFVGSANTGSFTVTNGSGSISRTISADVSTEGTEIFTISVREGSTTGTVIVTSGNITIADTSIEPLPLNEAYYSGAYFPGITSSTPANSQKNSPTLLPNISAISANVGASSASSYHFTYIKTDGSWRYYAPNGLTIGSTGNYTVVEVGSGTWKYVQVAYDSEHMFGIKTSGELYAAGNNSNGQLGIGNTTNKNYSQLTQVGSATNWTKVCGAKSASIGLRSDGTIWCWGMNSGTQAGQLGLGGTTDVLSPTQVGSATHWVDIAAAPSQGTVFYALKNDGTLWYWGDATYGGGLGQGNSLVTTPTQIGVATDYAKIYGTYRGCRVIKTNGTLWGPYSSTSYSGSTFQQVGTDTDWAITEGPTFNWHAIKTNGTLWAINVYNFYGAAGTGNTTDVLVPTQVGSDTNWRNLASTTQYYGTVAIK